MCPQNKSSLSQIGEFGLIDLIARLSMNTKAIRGIGDDAAVLPLSKEKHLLLTTDMLMEGVHFTKVIGPRWIGHKALACSMSDIAAMGGKPTYAVVSLGVPAQLKVDFVKKIYEGMHGLAKKFSVEIVGGDTILSEKIVINVALLGEALKQNVILRSTARSGDLIFVTGVLGKSLRTGKHFSFTPRLKESQFLVQHFKPTSMIDISDGLSSDLGHILKMSRVGAVLYEDLIPKTKGATLHDALSDGEDFELLLTVRPQEGKKLLKRHSKICISFVLARSLKMPGL